MLCLSSLLFRAHLAPLICNLYSPHLPVIIGVHVLAWLFITHVAIYIAWKEEKQEVDGEGGEIKIDQTVSCANIWQAFGLKEIKDKARQSEGRDGRAAETFDGLSTCRQEDSRAQNSDMNSGTWCVYSR